MLARVWFVSLLWVSSPLLVAAEPTLTFNDPAPQRYELTARASQIDPRAKEHPEIEFVFEKQGKPADVEHATVDTRVPSRGRLVIWLMGHSQPLFERISSYGLHGIQVHYANSWFGTLSPQAPATDDKYLGKIRLEAATGEDTSDAVTIPKPDGMTERAYQFVKWLAKENPQGRWDYFLTDDKQGSAGTESSWPAARTARQPPRGLRSISGLIAW